MNRDLDIAVGRRRVDRSRRDLKRIGVRLGALIPVDLMRAAFGMVLVKVVRPGKDVLSI